MHWVTQTNAAGRLKLMSASRTTRSLGGYLSITAGAVMKWHGTLLSGQSSAVHHIVYKLAVDISLVEASHDLVVANGPTDPLIIESDGVPPARCQLSKEASSYGKITSPSCGMVVRLV